MLVFGSLHRITPLHSLLTLTIRIHDSLLTRLSNDDDMEKSLSTFANEMASSAMILGTQCNLIPGLAVENMLPLGIASSNSLVLIDEVGRGTSPKEGVGISHAIAESLIRLKVSYFIGVPT